MKGLNKSIRRQEWKIAVEEWQASGLSIREWCQRQDIADSTFHYWKKLFSSVSKPSRPSFFELFEEKKSRIEMELGGIKIYAESGFDENLLVHCLKVLKKASSC